MSLLISFLPCTFFFPLYRYYKRFLHACSLYVLLLPQFCFVFLLSRPTDMGNKPAFRSVRPVDGSAATTKDRLGGRFDDFRDQMVPCESHPDLHMASCVSCYRFPVLQRLRMAATRNLPRIKRRKKDSSGYCTSDSEATSVSLILFRSSEIEDDRSWTTGTPNSSEKSIGSAGSGGYTKSCTGSLTSSKRWKRGRSQKRWSSPKSDPQYTDRDNLVVEFKSVWPVPLKDSMFLPEFPLMPALRRPSFEVLQNLSKGNFSTVSRIRMRGTGEQFALKQMAKVNIIRTHAVEQVKTEAAIQNTLVHPFILSSVATWQTRSHVCIVTGYAGGGDLGALWMDFGAFPESVVQVWGAELALGLKHLHNYGIIYRDLKLQNILLDCDGHLKVSDFGLARFASDLPRTMTICGTLDCMAPEVLQGESYDFTADWWSFGVALYALLVGRYPVLPEEDHVLMAEKVRKHVYFGFDGVDSMISPAAGSLLTKLLRKDPAKRLRDFQLLRNSAFFCSLNFAHVYRKLISPFAIMNFAHVLNRSGKISEPELLQEGEFSFMD